MLTMVPAQIVCVMETLISVQFDAFSAAFFKPCQATACRHDLAESVPSKYVT